MLSVMDVGTTQPGAATDLDLFCPACSYNLSGSVSAKCPECGYDLSGLRSRQCRIPWVHRRVIGRLRAYFATVWMVMFRNRRFCEEYARPTVYRDARIFQMVTVFFAFIPFVAVTLAAYATFPPDNDPVSGSPSTTAMLAYGDVWPVVLLNLCVLLFLLVATGLPSYFFHARAIAVENQNRALALSYFTCAPAAFLGVAGVVYASGHVVTENPLNPAIALIDAGLAQVAQLCE